MCLCLACAVGSTETARADRWLLAIPSSASPPHSIIAVHSQASPCQGAGQVLPARRPTQQSLGGAAFPGSFECQRPSQRAGCETLIVRRDAADTRLLNAAGRRIPSPTTPRAGNDHRSPNPGLALGQPLCTLSQPGLVPGGQPVQAAWGEPVTFILTLLLPGPAQAPAQCRWPFLCHGISDGDAAPNLRKWHNEANLENPLLPGQQAN